MSFYKAWQRDFLHCEYCGTKIDNHGLKDERYIWKLHYCCRQCFMKCLAKEEPELFDTVKVVI